MRGFRNPVASGSTSVRYLGRTDSLMVQIRNGSGSWSAPIDGTILTPNLLTTPVLTVRNRPTNAVSVIRPASRTAKQVPDWEPYRRFPISIEGVFTVIPFETERPSVVVDLLPARS